MQNKKPKPNALPRVHNWRTTFSVYKDTRLVKILLLGFISGLPWLLIASMVSLWLKEEGLSLTGIGLFSLVFTVYAVNALWAPVVDGLRIAWLSRAFGRRRAWIVAMQIVIACVLVAISMLPQVQGNLWLLAALMFVIALASATQDVAIDALRIELIGQHEPHKIGPAAAMATSGWWLGFGGGKAFALPFVQYLQTLGVERAWQFGYLAIILVVVASVFLLLRYVHEERCITVQTTSATKDSSLASWFSFVSLVAASEALGVRVLSLYWQPLRSFIVRYSLGLAVALLFFIFFFKIGEAFLGRMSLVFYNEIGFSKSEIGLLSGGLGTITVCVFAVFGSLVNARYGLFKGILVGGLAMASTNLLFALLAHYPERWLFITAVVTDQFTAAVSTVAVVAFLSQLCDRAHTATQYAALASLGNLSRTTFAASSGLLVDGLGGNWSLFFIITVLMVLPSLVLLLIIRRPLAKYFEGHT